MEVGVSRWDTLYINHQYYTRILAPSGSLALWPFREVTVLVGDSLVLLVTWSFCLYSNCTLVKSCPFVSVSDATRVQSCWFLFKSYECFGYCLLLVGQM